MPGRRRGAPSANDGSPAATRDEPREPAFPIVGIGASAGGYEAFVRLLQALPADTGMAFVLLMHLEPEHKSMLAKLLGNLTSMTVAEARNGMRVEPNHVYVIPPKADMSLKGGVLKIVGRRTTGGRHLPVDYFLTSLAEDRHDRAVGVILSGTGSDGMDGMKAVKAEGGITFAQDEVTAKHYGMPGSAIGAGCVDFVLPPDRIGEELDRLARHPYIGVPPAARLALEAPVGDSDFRKILYLLRSANRVDLSDYKPGTIRRRIARRMALLKIESLKGYLSHLQLNPPELEALFQDILIHVTSFFREPEAFKSLQTRIFSKMISAKNAGEPIRIWIPGCSSGEEVYSLAIALLEFLGDRAPAAPIQIFGTDISDQAIEKSRSGIFSENTLKEVSATRLRRFFARAEGGYRVNKALRDVCVFARQDLTRDPPFSRIDLISCRNVLIYMGAPLQKRILTGFHYALREGGFLLLGKSEALTSYPDLFIPADRKARIFCRRSISGMAAPEYSLPSLSKSVLAAPALEEPVFDALKEADRLMWQRYSHAGLVLNDALEILHFRGDTSPFVSPASGKASLHVLRIVKEELKMELRSAINRARRSNAPVRASGLRVKQDDGVHEVNLEVEPLQRPGSKERYFLVLFEVPRKPSALPPAEKGLEARARRGAESRELIRLRRELAGSREYLQSVLEQQEAGNEELKSANEEILSSNEELQSTNEELETAKEELQSTNEELVTLNETLQNRNLELAKLSDDLNNVLDGADVPILIVGADARIRRFTPSAGNLLNLLPGDIGRPINNIRPNIDVPDLETLVRQVNRTFTELRQEVRDKEKRWYSMRIRPYRTAENRIDGVLMALMDIDAQKRANQALTESDAMVRGLVETLLRAILVIDSTGRIVMVNASVETMFGYRRDELIGKTIEVLLPERLRAEHVQHRAGYFALPAVRLMGAGHELLGRRRDGGEFPLEVSLSYVQTTTGMLAVASILDLTAQRRVERTLAEKERALQSSEQQLQMFTASLLTAQEEERERLARDLHDDLNQRLAALALKAGALEQQFPDAGDSARHQIRGVHMEIDKLSEDVRRLAHQLHPSVLEHFGLAKALGSYCEEFARLKDLRIRYRQRDVPEDVPQDVTLCLYRVAQAALANIAQHSGAEAASVVLAGVAGCIRLVVSDRGSGFDAAAASAQPGLGLISMRERARLVGGTLSVKSRPGDGCRIEASVRLKPSAQDSG